MGGISHQLVHAHARLPRPQIAAAAPCQDADSGPAAQPTVGLPLMSHFQGQSVGQCLSRTTEDPHQPGQEFGEATKVKKLASRFP